MAWLRHSLRATPYWITGHQIYSEASLRAGDISGAYASAMTVLHCEPLGSLARDAKIVLASCYLRSGGATRTVEILSELSKVSDLPVHAKEDLAAAYMALNQMEQARGVLEKVPVGELSIAGRAAVEFLRK